MKRFVGGVPALAMLCFALTSRSQPGPSREPPTVGMEGRVEVLLPESGLSAKTPDRRTPMLVRIASSRPHGTLTYYDLRYIGRVPGQYDLRAYLAAADGRPATGLPALPVTVKGILPVLHNGWLEEQALRAPSLFGGYRAVATVVAAFWVVAFFLIIRVGRKRKALRIESPVVRPPT
ncbi:MAG: hypothetical protein DMG07_22515, partial [Acidobacteria bacterium]